MTFLRPSPLCPRLARPLTRLLAGASLLALGACNNVGGLGGGVGGVTELYIRNDTGETIVVSYMTREEAGPLDGMIEAPAGERSYLVEDVAADPLAPSDILVALTVTNLAGDTTLLQLDEIDDAVWVAGEDNSGPYSEFELVVVAP